MRLGVFSLLTFLAIPSIVGLTGLWMTGRWSHEALFVAGFFSALIVIRTVLKVYSIPERELRSEGVLSGTATSRHGDVDVSESTRNRESLPIGS